MKYIIVTSALALLSNSSFAAGTVFVHEPVPTAVVQLPLNVWTGAYIGTNVGYGMGKMEAVNNHYYDPQYSGSESFKTKGWSVVLRWGIIGSLVRLSMEPRPISNTQA